MFRALSLRTRLLLPPAVVFLLLLLMAGIAVKSQFDARAQLEAQRLEETRQEREAFLATLRAELERQAAEKGVQIRLPPAPTGSGGGGASSGGRGSAGGQQQQH